MLMISGKKKIGIFVKRGAKFEENHFLPRPPPPPKHTPPNKIHKPNGTFMIVLKLSSYFSVPVHLCYPVPFAAQTIIAE